MSLTTFIKSQKYKSISKYKLFYEDFKWYLWTKKKWERWVLVESTLKNNKQHNYLSKKAFKTVNGAYVIKNK